MLSDCSVLSLAPYSLFFFFYFHSLTELIRKITGKSVPKECRLLVLSMVCENEELDDDLPPVHIVLQPTSSQKQINCVTDQKGSNLVKSDKH